MSVLPVPVGANENVWNSFINEVTNSLFLLGTKAQLVKLDPNGVYYAYFETPDGKKFQLTVQQLLDSSNIRCLVNKWDKVSEVTSAFDDRSDAFYDELNHRIRSHFGKSKADHLAFSVCCGLVASKQGFKWWS